MQNQNETEIHDKNKIGDEHACSIQSSKNKIGDEHACSIQSSKNKIVEKFIENNKHEAIQGSEQWLRDRRFVIGGSEVSIISGDNCYSTIDELVAQKVGFSNFTGNNATRWGSLFENTSEIFFKTLFSVSVSSTGSIPHKSITNHRYSPDGLCILEYDKNYIYKIKPNKQQLITLLEFKSPYGSVPIRSVPKHYLPQVKAGLCTIDIAEIGLFMNNMFRKCSLNQLNFSMDYDRVYHRDSELKLKNIFAPVANGIMLVSMSKDKIQDFMSEINLIKQAQYTNVKSVNSNELDDLFFDSDSNSDDDQTDEIYDDGTHILYKIYDIIKHFDSMRNQSDFSCVSGVRTARNQSDFSCVNLIDLGSQKDTIFNQFLSLYKPEEKESLFNITYVKPQLNKTLINSNAHNILIPDELKYVTELENLQNICKKYDFNKIIDKFSKRCLAKNEYPIAVLPWKLLRSSNILVHKEDDYMYELKDKIDSTIDIIKQIMEYESYYEKMEKYIEHFPDNVLARQYINSKVSIDILDDLQISDAESNQDSD
ncbi:MAG: YqaJ viral recombinase family protein [Cetobacterium sp.]